MDRKYYCELVNLGLCTGCVGIAEKDWVGKQQCKYYQDVIKKLKKNKGLK